MTPARRHLSILAAAALCCCLQRVAAQAPNDAADVARLIELLDLRSGSVVADIGAGEGPLSIGIAPHVADGRVYATDLGARQLQAIRDAAARAALKNVSVIEGGLS